MSSRRRRKLARLRGYGKQSRPTRARGLKLYVEEQHGLVPVVAPHAGAWVETTVTAYHRSTHNVAPHAGAWVETCAISRAAAISRSRAPRGRVGSKISSTLPAPVDDSRLCPIAEGRSGAMWLHRKEENRDLLGKVKTWLGTQGNRAGTDYFRHQVY